MQLGMSGLVDYHVDSHIEISFAKYEAIKIPVSGANGGMHDPTQSNLNEVSHSIEGYKYGFKLTRKRVRKNVIQRR